MKSFLKVHVHVSLEVFHHWINTTCEKVVINGQNLKKLAQKNQIGKSGGERKQKS